MQEPRPVPQTPKGRNLLARVPAATIGLIGRFSIIPIQTYLAKHPTPFQEGYFNSLLTLAKGQGAEFFDALGWYTYIATAIEYLFPQWAYEHQGTVRLLGVLLPPAIDLLLESGIIPFFPYDPQIKQEFLAALFGTTLSLMMEKLLMKTTNKFIPD